MKRAIVLVLTSIALVLLLTSCSSGNDLVTNPPSEETVSLAEMFLDTRSDVELVEIGTTFQYIRYGSEVLSYETIDSASKISQKAMHLFFTSTNPDIADYYNRQDGYYHFPTTDIQAYTDRYFDSYVCIFADMVAADKSYREGADEIVVAALGSPSTPNFQLASKEAIDFETVEIKLNDFDLDGKEMLYTTTLTLRIVEGGYRFISSVISK